MGKKRNQKKRRGRRGVGGQMGRRRCFEPLGLMKLLLMFLQNGSFKKKYIAKLICLFFWKKINHRSFLGCSLSLATLTSFNIFLPPFNNFYTLCPTAPPHWLGPNCRDGARRIMGAALSRAFSGFSPGSLFSFSFFNPTLMSCCRFCFVLQVFFFGSRDAQIKGPP